MCTEAVILWLMCTWVYIYWANVNKWIFHLGTLFSTSPIRPGSRCFGWPSASPSTTLTSFTRCQMPTTSNATAGHSSVNGWSKSSWTWTTAHPLSEDATCRLIKTHAHLHTNKDIRILELCTSGLCLIYTPICNKYMCQVWSDVANSHFRHRLAITSVSGL